MNKDSIQKTAQEILDLSEELSGDMRPATRQDAIAAIQAAILDDVSDSIMAIMPES